MKVWLPLIRSGGGADVLTDAIGEGLRQLGWDARRHMAYHYLQYFPWAARAIAAPPSTNLIATHSWHGPAFYRRGIPLVVIEHLFTADDNLSPYRSVYQEIFHRRLVQRFVAYSYLMAEATVSVSDFTRRQILDFAPGTRVHTIYNGTDLDFFRPATPSNAASSNRPFTLLFAGNLIARKGVDLIPRIMQALGDGFQLVYTSGLRTPNILDEIPNAICLGRLNREQMRAAYQDADLLLFPSRMEGLPLAIIEAAACGLPAVTTDVSSMPEAVVDRVTGRLCERDSVDSFVSAILELREDRLSLLEMGKQSRALAERRFDGVRMVGEYRQLFERTRDEYR